MAIGGNYPDGATRRETRETTEWDTTEGNSGVEHEVVFPEENSREGHRVWDHP
jgi:hypothetical protein